MTALADRSARPHVWPTPRRRRRLLLRVVIVVAVVAGFVLGPMFWIRAATFGTTHDDAASTPTRPTAIVLGAGVREDGSPRPFLQARLDRVVELWRDGKVRDVLVTGDNRTRWYDEPKAMREYLVAAGVPADAIESDAAGYDTYDSCARAAQVFGVRSAVVVTQDYHLPRAVYTCRTLGIDAEGSAVGSRGGDPKRLARFHVREVLAGMGAIFELHLERRAPRETVRDVAPTT